MCWLQLFQTGSNFKETTSIMIGRKFLLINLIFLSYTLSGCVFGNLTFSDGKDWIPKDFHTKTDILLIEQYPNKNINDDMIEYLSKNFRGEYEVVGREIILNKIGKYADAELYKFGFLWETNDMNTKPIGHFFDRYHSKHNPSTTKTNRYQSKNAYKSYISTIDLFYKK